MLKEPEENGMILAPLDALPRSLFCYQEIICRISKSTHNVADAQNIYSGVLDIRFEGMYKKLKSLGFQALKFGYSQGISFRWKD